MGGETKASAIPADLLLRHGRVITLDPTRRILTDGAVAVRDGRIVAIGPDREVAPAVEAAAVRDLASAVVHPGFVDAHAHHFKEIIRGLIPEVLDWSRYERPFLDAKTAEHERLSATLTCMEMVANGTTAYANTGDGFYLHPEVEAARQVGLRAMPGFLLADIAGGHERMYTPTERCLERLVEQLERYPFRSDARVRCGVTLWGMTFRMVSERLLVDAKRLADRYGVPLTMHQSWGKDEVSACLERTGKRPVHYLADRGILGPNVTLVHMIQLDDSEIEPLAASGTSVVHCPGASTRRGMGAVRIGRIPEMLDSGVVVALGSDGHSGTRNLARQAYLAATLHREMRGRFPVIDAYTAFEMATLHGARALGLEAEIGSLEVGKRADLVIHSTSRPESRPHLPDPVMNLVYHSHTRTVDSVMVDGELIFEHGRFTRLSAEAAYAEIDAAVREVEPPISRIGRGPWPVVT